MQPQPKKIHYIGQDQVHWEVLKRVFQSTYPRMKFSFKALYAKDPSHIKRLISKITTNSPKVIFIDFSTDLDEMLRLAYFLRLESSTRRIPIIGLLDSQGPEDVLRKGLSLGVNTFHFKGIETLDPVHFAFQEAFPEEALKLDYAIAKVEKDIEIFGFVRINSYDESKVEVESNFPLHYGETIHMENSLLPHIPLTGIFEVGKETDLNLYSHYPKKWVLKYNHLTNPELEQIKVQLPILEEELKKKYHKGKKETIELIESIKGRISLLNFNQDKITKSLKENLKKVEADLKDWVNEHKDESKEKLTRILIIDRSFKFIYQSQDAIDSFPFSIRCHSHVIDEEKMLKSNFPGIIVFELDPKEKVDEGADYYPNNVASLEKVIKCIQGIDGLNPYLFIFNCDPVLKSVIQKFHYPNILFYEFNIRVDLVKKLAFTYEEKIKNSDNFEHQSIVISKYSPNSVGKIKLDIQLKAISEVEMVFTCQRFIKNYTCFQIRHPFELYLTIVPSQHSSPNKKLLESRKSGGNAYSDGPLKPFTYLGILHGIDEVKKQDLRKYVNTFFFTRIIQQREVEKEEFENIKQEYTDKGNEKKEKN